MCEELVEPLKWPATQPEQVELKVYRAGSDFTGRMEEGRTLDIVLSIASCDDGDPVTGGGFTISGTNIALDDIP